MLMTDRLPRAIEAISPSAILVDPALQVQGRHTLQMQACAAEDPDMAVHELAANLPIDQLQR